MDFSFPFDAHRRAGIPMQGQTWSRARYRDEDLATMVFEGCTFEEVVFERIDLRQTAFANCRFDGCRFEDCQIGATLFGKCEGSGFTIVGGLLTESVVADSRFEWLVIEQTGFQLTLSESRFGRLAFNGDGTRQRSLTLSGMELDSLTAENAVWTDATLVGLALAVCRLDGGEFERTSFIRAEGQGLDLGKLTFRSCNLFQSNFSDGRIASAESCIFAESVVEGIDCTGAELSGALFANARADGARFDRANLAGALFPDASLRGASFQDAVAPKSVWTGADLTDARLQRLFAAESIFRNARLAGVDVTGASFVSADLHGIEESLDGADTRDARGTLPWRAEVEGEGRREPR